MAADADGALCELAAEATALLVARGATVPTAAAAGAVSDAASVAVALPQRCRRPGHGGVPGASARVALARAAAALATRLRAELDAAAVATAAAAMAMDEEGSVDRSTHRSDRGNGGAASRHHDATAASEAATARDAVTRRALAAELLRCALATAGAPERVVAAPGVLAAAVALAADAHEPAAVCGLRLLAAAAKHGTPALRRDAVAAGGVAALDALQRRFRGQPPLLAAAFVARRGLCIGAAPTVVVG